MTSLKAYNAMFKLLAALYNKTRSDDIGALLGSMLFISEENTADPALWSEWQEAINDQKRVDKKEAFSGMIRFLTTYYQLTSSDDIKDLVERLKSAKNEDDVHVHVVEQWNRCLQEALGEKEEKREYLFYEE